MLEVDVGDGMPEPLDPPHQGEFIPPSFCFRAVVGAVVRVCKVIDRRSVTIIELGERVQGRKIKSRMT